MHEPEFEAWKGNGWQNLGSDKMIATSIRFRFQDRAGNDISGDSAFVWWEWSEAPSRSVPTFMDARGNAVPYTAANIAKRARSPIGEKAFQARTPYSTPSHPASVHPPSYWKKSPTPQQPRWCDLESSEGEETVAWQGASAAAEEYDWADDLSTADYTHIFRSTSTT